LRQRRPSGLAEWGEAATGCTRVVSREPLKNKKKRTNIAIVAAARKMLVCMYYI